MAWSMLVSRWLAQGALGGLIVLALGSIAVRLCRQPARRARLVVLILLGGMAVPWLGAIPGAPRWRAVSWPSTPSTSPLAVAGPSARTPAAGPGRVEPR